MEGFDLSVLDKLEAEAIQIFREVAAEFERPVMMYSIGWRICRDGCGKSMRPIAG